MTLDIPWQYVIPGVGTLVALVGLLAKPVGKCIDRRSERRRRQRAANERIYNEAVALERELKAALWEPRSDQLAVWAQSCQQGFNLEEQRFAKLAELAVEAPGPVKKLVRAERERFLNDVARPINDALVGALNEAKYDAIRYARQQLRRCHAGVGRIITATG